MICARGAAGVNRAEHVGRARAAAGTQRTVATGPMGVAVAPRRATVSVGGALCNGKHRASTIKPTTRSPNQRLSMNDTFGQSTTRPSRTSLAKFFSPNTTLMRLGGVQTWHALWRTGGGVRVGSQAKIAGQTVASDVAELGGTACGVRTASCVRRENENHTELHAQSDDGGDLPSSLSYGRSSLRSEGISLELSSTRTQIQSRRTGGIAVRWADGVDGVVEKGAQEALAAHTARIAVLVCSALPILRACCRAVVALGADSDQHHARSVRHRRGTFPPTKSRNSSFCQEKKTAIETQQRERSRRHYLSVNAIAQRSS